MDMRKSPFADPEQPETGNSQQPGVVGFGYINNAHESDNGPKVPLKSALKVPGTPARQITNPLSPTFREEEILEKREARNDQQQAKDIVRFPSALLNLCTNAFRAAENQDTCPHGQVCLAWRQLQLLADHLVHAVGVVCHFQFDQFSGRGQQVHALGSQYAADGMAAEAYPFYGLRLLVCLYLGILFILPRRS